MQGVAGVARETAKSGRRPPLPLSPTQSAGTVMSFLHSSGRRASMKHYRINKLAKIDGVVIKKKDILARSDAEAVRHAAIDIDCPICDVMRDGKKVGAIV